VIVHPGPQGFGRKSEGSLQSEVISADPKEAPETAPVEEPEVSPVEYAPLVVVEGADDCPESRIPVPDVRHTHQHEPVRFHDALQFGEQMLGSGKVFQDVGRHHHVVPAANLARNPPFEVGLDEP